MPHQQDCPITGAFLNTEYSKLDRSYLQSRQFLTDAKSQESAFYILSEGVLDDEVGCPTVAKIQDGKELPVHARYSPW